MRIAALEAVGIDEQIIGLWEEAGHSELLPVQEIAVRDCGVLNGNNVLVFSPTSSGKTFVGEMAAIKMARQSRRVIYLVPQKALAEEKYAEFRRKYSPFGVRIVISTRDRREFDRAINRGEFHIAVVVFEKMQGLLVTNPALLSNVGLVIVDELQMIGDEARGPGLEILLTKMKLSEGKPQIIGLSAVLGNCADLAKWLGAALCQTDRRPVELRKGVLWNGTFRYVEHNSGKEGVEKLVPVRSGTDVTHVLIAQAQAFVGAGEQSLVFCKSKGESMKIAAAIAEELDAKPAKGALEEMEDLEDSLGRDNLLQLLKHGVAYHNSNLDWDQRDIIERWFRRGEISVLCATTTLAMGINLPAKNVFLDPQRWAPQRSGRWSTVPIPQSEYENMSGRAGRLGLEATFGRAIIITDSEFDARTYYDNFVNGTLGDIHPALGNDPLAQHVLNLIASGICQTEDSIREVLLSSYTGELQWRGGAREEEFNQRLSEGVKHCVAGELIETKKGLLVPTELGRLAAVKGVSVETAIGLAEFARALKGEAGELHLLEILMCLTGTEDGQSIYFNLSTFEHRREEYGALLETKIKSMPSTAQKRLREKENFSHPTYDETKRIKKALLLYDWVTDIPTREIETRYHCFTGNIIGLAAEFSWLAEAFSAIARVCGWPDTAVDLLRALSGQLVHGVPADGVKIATARVRGLGRSRIRTLLAAGLNTLEKIMKAPAKQVGELVTRPVASRLLRRIASVLEREEVRRDVAEEEAESDVTEADDIEEPGADWDGDFPPSDDIGAAYLSDAMIVMDGRSNNDRRHLVVLGGKETWLTGSSFEAALKLAVAAKTAELGWLDGTDLGTEDRRYQIIRRLKKDFKVEGVDPEQLVQNNRTKQYRLSVPPGNIKIDAKMIRRHLPEHDSLLREYEAAEPLLS